jgi:hypothetical protein
VYAVIRPKAELERSQVCRLCEIRATAAGEADGTLELVNVDDGSNSSSLDDGHTFTESMLTVIGVLDQLPQTRDELQRLRKHIKDFLWGH